MSRGKRGPRILKNADQFMNSAQKIIRRQKYIEQTWEYGNAQPCGRESILFDAGELGFCLLEWSSRMGGKWENRWFDEAVLLPSNASKGAP